MGRRRKGRAISGWLVVDKPAGPTSTAIVGRVRRALDARKAGHAGTLDPTATGVLAVALGEATKTVPYVTDAQKVYRFTVRLGRATSTDDGEGEVVAESDVRPEDAEIAAALPGFTGNIQQVPPQFSAVRVAGERAYDRARQGETLDLAPRPLHVAALEMVGRPDRDHVLLEMTCGKGGYVRSIARDLGAALGCHGHVVALRRVRAGPFAAESGVPLDRIEALAADGTLEGHLRPLEAGLADVAEVPCIEESVRRLRNGNPARVVATEATYGDTVWASHAGRAVAVGVYRAGELHPARVFAE